MTPIYMDEDEMAEVYQFFRNLPRMDGPGRPSPPKKRFVCPICHRRFHGKGALRQHTADKHPEETPDASTPD